VSLIQTTRPPPKGPTAPLEGPAPQCENLCLRRRVHNPRHSVFCAACVHSCNIASLRHEKYLPDIRKQVLLMSSVLGSTCRCRIPSRTNNVSFILLVDTGGGGVTRNSRNETWYWNITQRKATQNILLITDLYLRKLLSNVDYEPVCNTKVVFLLNFHERWINYPLVWHCGPRVGKKGLMWPLVWKTLRTRLRQWRMCFVVWWVLVMWHIEHSGPVVNTPVSYSGGTRFKPCPESGCPGWCILFSSVHPGKCWVSTLN
jgi:hypothetical protein